MFNNGYSPYFNYNNGINTMSGLKKINWTSFLDGAQRTLGVINQAIPIFYQIKPLYENARTALRVVNAIKEDDTKVNVVKKEMVQTKKVEPKNSSNGPTYFL